MVEVAYQREPARPGKEKDEQSPVFSQGLSDRQDGKSLEEDKDFSDAVSGCWSGVLVSHLDEVVCEYLGFCYQKTNMLIMFIFCSA